MATTKKAPADAAGTTLTAMAQSAPVSRLGRPNTIDSIPGLLADLKATIEAERVKPAMQRHTLKGLWRMLRQAYPAYTCGYKAFHAYVGDVLGYHGKKD